jgi:alkaline phosphatase
MLRPNTAGDRYKISPGTHYMISLFGRYLRCVALLWATLLCTVLFTLELPFGEMSALADSGNGVNVIIMIGDGMGWQMARAAAIANGAPAYKGAKV